MGSEPKGGNTAAGNPVKNPFKKEAKRRARDLINRAFQATEKASRIRYLVSIPTAIVLVLFIAIFVYAIYSIQQADLRIDLENEFAAVQKLFEAQKAHEVDLMEAVATTLADNPALQEAWRQKDRASLLEHTQQLFAHLRRDYHITHFYFHDTNGVNFLRVHAPEKHDDVITRQTLAAAQSQGEVSNGIEAGPLGTFTLRVVKPWQVNGQTVGFIELGKSIEYFTESISRDLGVELIVSLDKGYFDKAKFEKRIHSLQSPNVWEQFPDKVIIDQTTKPPEEIIHWLQGSAPASLSEGEQIATDSQFFYVNTFPIHDMGNHKIGEIAVLIDITEKHAALIRSVVMTSLLSLGMAFALMFFLYLIFSQVEKNLKDANLALKESEEKHRTIYNSLTDVFYETDMDGVLIEISPSSETLFGYKPEELIGKKASEFYAHPPEREKLLAELRKKGSVSDYEVTLLKRGGEQINVSVNTKIVSDPSGKPVMVQGIIRDISARKQSEQELQKAFETTEAILDGVPFGVIVVGEDRRIRRANQAALNIMEAQADEVVGHICHNNICPSPPGQCPIWDLHKNVSNAEKVVLGKNGKEIPVLKTALRIYLNGEHVLLETFVDITELKKTQTALEAERTQLLSIFDSISEMIYVADPITYEVLYVNKTLREVLSYDPVGKICYRVFQGLDKPCDFCTNEIILKEKGKPYLWEYHNSILQRDFMLMDRIIKWSDGRDVRFELAIDITERKKAERELTVRMKELEEFNNLAIGRELRMIELKQEINSLRAQLGEKPKYEAV